MQKIDTQIAGCFIIKPTKFEDERGYFIESFNNQKFKQISGITARFVQDNQSYSTFGVLRGLHAQQGAHAQAKLVRVLQGEVLDIVVDVRQGSPTLGTHVAVKLSEQNQLQLYIPRGFLHGFVVLSESANFFYKCDNYYNKRSECGVKYDDADLNIDWLLPKEQLCISEKDQNLPSFAEIYKK